MSADPFEEHLERWQAWAEAPWGRIRFAVVAEVLRRQVERLQEESGRTTLRVLDVGGGDARDSLPLALAGHEVTVVDTAPGMLAEARRRAADAGATVRTLELGLDDLTDSLDAVDGGGCDLVLCHFVLHYRPAGAGDLARLASRVRSGGLLSVVGPQRDARVLASLVREGPAAALTALRAADEGTWASTVFAHEGRALPVEEVLDELPGVGLALVARYGGRIANDLVADDAAKHDPAFYADLERLELALCDREPHLRTGAFWQLVARRGGGT